MPETPEHTAPPPVNCTREQAVALARWSWRLPLLAWASQGLLMLLPALNQSLGRSGHLVVFLVQFGLVVAGIICGVRALRAIVQHGPAGIQQPATAGVIGASVTLLLAMSATA